MNITGLSFKGAIYPQYANTARQPRNVSSGNITIEKPKTKSINQRDFLKINGKLFYDAAIMGPLPYFGRINQDANSILVTSEYDNGRKSKIFIQNKDSFTNPIELYRAHLADRTDGSREVTWMDKSRMFSYKENYDENGALCQTELSKSGISKDGFKIITTYAEDGTTLLAQEFINNDNGANKAGFSRRMEEFECGVKSKVTEYSATKDNGTRTAAKRVAILSPLGSVKQSEEENVKYYSDKDASSPYASSSKRRTGTKRGEKVTVDFDYKTLDYNEGINPIRKLCFEEHPNTIREQKGNDVRYYDGFTKKLYAFEHYENGKDYPTLVLNADENCGIKIGNLASNLVRLEYIDENDRKTAMTVVQKKNGKYVPVRTDLYDEDKTRIASKTYRGNLTGVTHYSKYDRTMVTREELYASDQLILQNEYVRGELRKQIQTPAASDKIIIELNPKDKTAKETTYAGETDAIKSVALYQDGVMTSKTTFDKKGTPSEHKCYEGYYFDDKLQMQLAGTLSLQQF